MVYKQLERLMHLHVMIRNDYYPSSRAIHERFNVTKRTAYRDIKILRSLFKAPLAYDQNKRGYYYTQRDWNLFE